MHLVSFSSCHHHQHQPTSPPMRSMQPAASVAIPCPSSDTSIFGGLRGHVAWHWRAVPKCHLHQPHSHVQNPHTQTNQHTVRLCSPWCRATALLPRAASTIQATASAAADAAAGSWQHLTHFEVHPAVWLMLGTWVLAYTQTAASRAAAAAAASAGGPVEPPPSTTAVPGTAAGILAQVYVSLLLPCQLLLLASAKPVVAAANGTGIALFVLAVMYGALLTLTGSVLGWLCGSTILAIWQLTTRPSQQLSAWPGGAPPQQGSGSWVGNIKPTRRRRWLPVKLARWWARTSRALWSPVPSVEAALAAATASALGAPQATSALLPLKRVPPAWAPAAFACIGTAAAMTAAGPLATSTSLPELANHLAKHMLACIQAWCMELPVAGAVGAAAGSAGPAASTLCKGMWLQGAAVGQHMLLWGLLLPCLQATVKWLSTQDKARGQDAWLGRLRVSTEPGNSSPAAPDGPLSWVGTPGATLYGSSGSSSSSSSSSSRWSASNSSGTAQADAASKARSNNTSTPDFSEARVWVKVGNNQEVLLTPRELAQLVPFNTPLPGRLMPGGQPGFGVGSAGGGGDTPLGSVLGSALGSVDGEMGGEVVEAEVRDMPSAGDDAQGVDKEGQREKAEEAERLQPWWQRAGTAVLTAAASNPPLVALLIGLLLRAIHPSSLESAALAGTSTTPWQPGAFLRAPSLPDTAALTHPTNNALGASLIPHVLDLPYLDPGIIDVAGDSPGELPTTSFVPWDGRLIQLSLKTCIMCVAWAGAAAPWVLALFAGCTVAAACLSVSSSTGVSTGGLLDGRSERAGDSEGGWGLSLGNWKAYAGSQLPGVLHAARRLMIPSNVPELLLALCGVVVAHAVLPAALAWVTQAIAHTIHSTLGENTLVGGATTVMAPLSWHTTVTQLWSSSSSLLGSTPLLLLLLLRPVFASSPSKAMARAQAEAGLLLLRVALVGMLVQMLQGPALMLP